MIKRLFDMLASAIGLILVSPIFIPTAIAIWLQDYCSPFYVANRVGKGEKLFRMVKFRSMVKFADKNKVDSTAANDPRITAVGHFVRRYKLDELPQLWNVLKGDMSLVGPRPNVQAETNMYTKEEKKLLTVRPGITDFSSIVFSDEGDILKGKADPDISYNQLIRPWKSRLGIFYVEKNNVVIDIKIILLTLVAILDKKKALEGVAGLLSDLGADEQLKTVARRQAELVPAPPPGATEIVTSRL